MPVRTQDIYNLQYHCFQPIKVSFYNYPFISIHDRTTRTLLLLLTCLNMAIDKITTQTLWFSSYPGHLLTQERPLDTLSGISPRCSSATNSQLTTSSLYRYSTMANYAFFSQGSSQWGKDFLSLWGCLDIPPLLCQLHVTSTTQSELSSLTSLKAWGDAEKFCNDIAFLLVSTKEELTGDRMYGLSTVWVNPYQPRVSTVEAVRELTALVSSGPNWPYTLVQLNEDTHHVPLPKEGHLGILPEGGTNRTTCRRISQLEVHQLLQAHLQVIYPVGLNGCEIPLITTLPGSLANGTSLTGGESIYLEVDILQSIAGESDQKALLPGKCPSILTASSIKATPLRLKREVSMTM